MKRILLEIMVEQKDEHGALDNEPPSAAVVAAYVKDYTGDMVRNEYDINWMIRSVTPVEVN